jgi:hypothetical protein
VVNSGGTDVNNMAEKIESLTELAQEINVALVRLGKSNWRRDFNTRLWSCNRDKAIALINEYHDRLVYLARSIGWDDTEQQLFMPLPR